jgi:hypothetical protein
MWDQAKTTFINHKIMNDHSLETPSNHVRQEFMDLMQHGDDFYKIELWKPAKNWYKKAMALNIEPERVSQKIAACDKFLAFEKKVRCILVAIALALVLAYSILK